MRAVPVPRAHVLCAHACTQPRTESDPTPPGLQGDYWPGEAENLLANLGEEQRQAGKNSSKGGCS